MSQDLNLALLSNAYITSNNSNSQCRSKRSLCEKINQDTAN